MRMFMVSIVVLALLSFVTMTWYIFQPFTYAMITRSRQFTQDINPEEPANTLSANLTTLLGYCALWWGPLIDLILVIWWAMSAQKRDIESEYYG